MKTTTEEIEVPEYSKEERTEICRNNEIIAYFFNLTWDEIVSLSENGKVGPYKTAKECTEALLNGTKPIWFCTFSEGSSFAKSQPEFNFEIIPILKSRLNSNSKLKSGEFMEFLSCAVFKKENYKSFEKLVKSFEISDFKRGIELSSDIIRGDALGYTNNDIAKFIVHNSTQQKFDEWKKEIDHVYIN